jgi:O-methyltransferase
MLSTMSVQSLLERYPLLSDQLSVTALQVVLGALEQTLKTDVPGDIVEFGCYVGTASVFIRRVLDEHNESDKRKFYAYDSFEGLPDKSAEDASMVGLPFQGGELLTSKREYLMTFKKQHLLAPVTIKGWFKDLQANQVPDQIAFGFLDGDFYHSIFDSLVLVWPRLSPGGFIAIDDYQREALPGVTRAVADYFKDPGLSLRVQKNIGILRKP